MNARLNVMAPTDALRRLAQFLVESGNPLSPADAATQAINQWIAAAKGQFTNLVPTPTQGYQWKSLFLPHGTELRMTFARQSFYARVEGDSIRYQGQRVSPRQLTIAIAGDGHNAWRELWIRLPTATRWQPASLLRREASQAPAVQPLSPLEAMTAAAACMSETLKSALQLVDHAGALALAPPERRVAHARRTNDRLADQCAFD
ncbi:MAG TPA: hypothetical protein VF861_13180 [Telluria sp.]